MKASEMIATIKYVEKECHGITQMYASRINYFQNQNLPETQGVTYDEPFFSDFIKEMETKLKKVNRPTAKKILNNWYLWAKNNLEVLNKIEPFEKADISHTNYEFNKFIKRLNFYLYSTKKQQLKYLAVWEKQKRGAIHYHIIFFDLPFIKHKALQDIWGYGFIKINKIDVDSKENRGR